MELRLDWRSNTYYLQNIDTSDDMLKEKMKKIVTELRALEGISKAILNTIDTEKVVSHMSDLGYSCPYVNFEAIQATYGSINPFVLFICPIRLQKDGASLVVSEESKEIIEDFFKMKNRHREFVVIKPTGEEANHPVAVFRRYKNEMQEHKIHVFESRGLDRDFVYRRNALFCLSKFCFLIKSIEIPNLEEIIERTLNEKCSYGNLKRICHFADPRDSVNDKHVGTVQSRAYKCFLVTTVNEIKKSLTANAKAVLSSSIAEEIAMDFLRSLKEKLHDIAWKDLKDIKVLLERNMPMFEKILDIIKDICWGVVGQLVLIYSFIQVMFYPIDVNSREWRDKVAYEIYTQIEDKMKIMKTELLKEVQGVVSTAVQKLKDIGSLAEDEVLRLTALVLSPVTIAQYASDEPFHM